MAEAVVLIILHNKKFYSKLACCNKKLAVCAGLFYLLVVALEELLINELHDLCEERVALDEAHVESESIVMLMNRHYACLLYEHISCLGALLQVV